MYQIDNSTAAQAIPASTPAGSKGFFTDGNPATGTPATILPAEFMNMLMMENINVLAAAGIQPDKSKFNQLAQAISIIISSNLVWDKISAKPTTVASSGLTDAVTIGGSGLMGAAPIAVGSVSSLPTSKLVTYTAGNATDSPPGSPECVGLHVVNASTAYGADIAISVTAPKLFYRYRSSGVASSWVTVWDSNSFNPALKLNGDAATTAGFSTGNKTLPYIQHSDGTVVKLAPADRGVPSGAVVAFARNSAPVGYIKANGATLLIANYPDLYDAIGAVFGGNGTTTFMVPDLRAEFIRGFDDGRGIDTGRAFGSAQTDSLQGHNHINYYSSIGFAGTGGNSYAMFTSGGGNNTIGLTDSVRNPISDATSGSVRTASETRSRNVALLYCIKI
ncbi:phage tail protein [Pseudomonas tolaasii]